MLDESKFIIKAYKLFGLLFDYLSVPVKKTINNKNITKPKI